VVAGPVVVVGAGPAGLAAAAALRRRGYAPVVLERSGAVGDSWRRHYDRLHLHTTRRLSGLPGLPIPRAAGRWVARDDVARYLERYAARHRLDVRTGRTVTRVDRAPGGGWLVRVADGGTLAARVVVVATGDNRTPAPLVWPGLSSFTGEVRHAAGYRDPAPYRGRDVLVVGAGNSGAEIAVDLAQGGAARVRLAVRTPPHIVRRSTFGWPAQRTGILVRRLPARVVDPLARALERLTVPDLSARGLARPAGGLSAWVRAGNVPVQDVGLLAAVRAGLVEPVAAVVAFDGGAVVLVDGTRVAPDVVVAATGYRRDLGPLVGHLGVLDESGRPAVRDGRSLPRAPGLYFVGFVAPISGVLRELGFEARRLARDVARRR
jgi:putative flavoprotein involved in K+ transport